MTYLLLFYQFRSPIVASDSYLIDEAHLRSLGTITDNWLKAHPEGFIRIEVHNG